jgi:DNA-binding MarR family transcriptional regulator
VLDVLIGSVIPHRLRNDGFPPRRDSTGSPRGRILDEEVRHLVESSQAELSRCTTIGRSDMVASVNELAERGFVARSPDPDDGRRNVVTITASGRRELAKLDRLIARAQSEWLAPLSKKERAELVGLLTSVVDHHAPDTVGHAQLHGREH